MFSRKWMATLVMLLALQLTGQSRIGETRIECIERYGPQIKNAQIVKPIPTANWARFQSGKFIMDFAFVELQAVGVCYSTTSTILSASETMKILAAEGTGWQPFTPDEPMRTNSRSTVSMLLRSKEGLIAETRMPIAATVIIYTEWAFNRVYGKPLAKKAQPPSL